MVLGDDQLGASDPGPGAFSSAGRPHLTPLPCKPVSIRARPQTFCVLGVKGWGWATPGRRPQCPAPSPGGASGAAWTPQPGASRSHTPSAGSDFIEGGAAVGAPNHRAPPPSPGWAPWPFRGLMAEARSWDFGHSSVAPVSASIEDTVSSAPGPAGTDGLGWAQAGLGASRAGLGADRLPEGWAGWQPPPGLVVVPRRWAGEGGLRGSRDGEHHPQLWEAGRGRGASPPAHRGGAWDGAGPEGRGRGRSITPSSGPSGPAPPGPGGGRSAPARG